jgi:hypothetical protein
MPQVPSILHVEQTLYYVPQAAAESALAPPETVTGWDWEGIGFSGRLVAHVPDDETSGQGIPTGWTRRQLRTRKWEFEDLYTAFFEPENIPRAVFERVRVFSGTQDGTPGGTPVLFFDLQREGNI